MFPPWITNLYSLTQQENAQHGSWDNNSVAENKGLYLNNHLCHVIIKIIIIIKLKK